MHGTTSFLCKQFICTNCLEVRGENLVLLERWVSAMLTGCLSQGLPTKQGLLKRATGDGIVS